jgi:hypothetical protein
MRRIALLTLALWTFAPAVSAAQKKVPSDGLRFLSGVVTDQDARPLPRAAVQIENEKTLQIRSYITGEHGEFHFAELSPDADYDVRAEFDGIRSSKKTLSQFDSRPMPTITLVIRLPR